MAEPIISVSGLRGVIGSELTPEVVMRYVAAFCTKLSPGPIILSRDGRESGLMLKAAVVATLIGHGKTVLDADIAATPTVGVLVRKLSAAGAIQLTASHNPRQYNGIKLFNRQGRVIGPDEGNAVRDAYVNGKNDWKPINQLGMVDTIELPHEGHINDIVKTVQTKAIRHRGFKVLLDSNHGSGSLMGRTLLESLGCEVTIIGESPDGKFEHSPEPTESNLQQIAAQVSRDSFDVAFCQDPDADRLAIIDANGRYIGEEYTAVLCMLNAMEIRQTANQQNPIPSNAPKLALVTNCASSTLNQDIADRFGATLWRTKVGEANVIDAMIEHSAVYGGEGSGGPIDPRIGWVRDSFVGMAATLDLMARREQPLSEIVDELPSYAMIKDKIELANVDVQVATRELHAKLSAPQVSTLDGLRLDWPDAWLLVRGSNTEPIVRLICEATTADAARTLIDRAKQIVASI